MSIATLSRRANASVRYATSVDTRGAVPTRAEQLRDVRALFRRFVLAFSATAALLYAVAAGAVF